MVLSMAIFFCVNLYIFKNISKILLNFKRNIILYCLISFFNTYLMIYLYKIGIPYYIAYFLALIVLTIEFLLFSESKFNQAFLCSGVLIINMSIVQLIILPIYAYIIDKTPYEIFNNKTLFFNCFFIVFFILFIVFNILLRFVPIDDIKKISTMPIYSLVISIIIILILIYSITDVIVIHQKNYFVEYLPIFIATPILNAALFYILLFYSIKSVKMVAFKRKSDELEIVKLKKSINIKCMEDKILKDDLTSCYNRKYIMCDLTHKYENNIYNFALLFIDIDGLKCVNDNLGHKFGDEYIINISKILKEAVRENDLIARIGGDEFLIILNDLKEKDIKDILKRIHLKINFIDKITNSYKVSASIGYIFVDEELLKTGVENIIKIADDKMRREKSQLKGE